MFDIADCVLGQGNGKIGVMPIASCIYRHVYRFDLKW